MPNGGISRVEAIFFSASIAFTVLSFAVATLGFRSGFLKLPVSSDDVVEDLRKDVAELTAERIELKQHVEWLTKERNQLLQELVAATRSIEKLKRDGAILEAKLAEVQAAVDAQKIKSDGLRVLAIWPHRDLLVDTERQALSDAGISYEALYGERATKDEILRQMRIDGFTVIEIGAHGDAAGIHLASGDILDATFWIGVLHRRTIRMALLLACHSDTSIADAFRRSGVRFVIAATGEIADHDVGRFVRTFYQGYADGLDVERAFFEAKLILSRQQADLLVMHK